MLPLKEISNRGIFPAIHLLAFFLLRLSIIHLIPIYELD
jgi:hypothetical protein